MAGAFNAYQIPAVLGSGALSSKLELHVSCTNLAKKDLLSKSDPMAVLFAEIDGSWVEVDRSECLQNTHDPEFAHPFIVTYHFEEVQHFKFELYDVDGAAEALNSHDFLGSMDFLLSRVAHKGGLYEHSLRNKNGEETKSRISLRSEEINDCKQELILKFRSENVPQLDTNCFCFPSPSDPFLVISRCNEDGKYTPVFRSDVVMNTTAPRWKEYHVSVQRLSNGDLQRPLRIEMFDYDTDGSHDFVGIVETSINGLLASFGDATPMKMRDRRGSVIACPLIVERCELQQMTTFLDYIMGGTEMCMMVAIDFTASNGNPNDPRSLHNLGVQGQMNQYQQAIHSVGTILQSYDSDGRFPVWGFGGKINGQVSHCFNLNGESDPEVTFVEGILDAYQRALYNVPLSGPTCFSPFLQQMSALAREADRTSPGSKYFVALILTDGIVNDMDDTINAIVEASDLPLSIIIVGVGSADFEPMEVLDGDETPLHRLYTGRSKPGQPRDIVQFVPFKAFSSSPGRLASETLGEVPAQFLDYMRSRNIAPVRR